MNRGFMFAQKVAKGSEGTSYFVFDKGGVPIQAYPDAKLPEYATKNSAGADFFCAETVVIPSFWKGLIRAFNECLGARGMDSIKKFIAPTLVHTGIKSCMEDDEVLEIYNRSSGPKKRGLILANSVGIIDADYFSNPTNDGEIGFLFYNIMPFDVTIEVGERIGQGIFKKVLRPIQGFRIAHKEREGGFGSTDNN